MPGSGCSRTRTPASRWFATSARPSMPPRSLGSARLPAAQRLPGPNRRSFRCHSIRDCAPSGCGLRRTGISRAPRVGHPPDGPGCMLAGRDARCATRRQHDAKRYPAKPGRCSVQPAPVIGDPRDARHLRDQGRARCMERDRDLGALGAARGPTSSCSAAISCRSSAQVGQTGSVRPGFLTPRFGGERRLQHLSCDRRRS
jgi:hypothetical protein